MPRYLYIASYTAEGGLRKAGGTAVLERIAKIAESFDTKPDDGIFTFGEDDLYLTWSLPDNETAAAISLAMSASGELRIRTIVGMEPEELDRAVERAAAAS